MSNPSPPLCVQCGAQPAHNVNCYGRGRCAFCLARYLELEVTGPPKDREDIWGRLAAWDAPPDRVTVCWHVAPGEDWSNERWRGYLVEWVAVTPFTPLMLCTEPEQCEQSGELRQIIRWRLWKAGVPGFAERFLARDLTWETIARKTGNTEYASMLHDLIGKPRRGPLRGRGITPEAFIAKSNEGYIAHRADFGGRDPTHDYVAKYVGYSKKHWGRLARQFRYQPPA